MIKIKATIQGRRLELNAPADWPDGTEVEIQPLQQNPVDRDEMSPAEIAEFLAAMDQMEPVEMTDAEWAKWEAARNARKDEQKARFVQRADELRRLSE